jgi:hypothetical protein
MIDLSEIALAPEFSQDYTIYRKSATWAGGRITQTETTISTSGTVTNATPEELEQLPEADRITGTKVFYNSQVIHTTRTDGTSDEISLDGKRYRVTGALDYSGQGFYKAFAVYMAGV